MQNQDDFFESSIYENAPQHGGISQVSLGTSFLPHLFAHSGGKVFSHGKLGLP